ncbi:hypothetical protein NL676_038483 [Syzygium grande]|nr:hypothetical protein NL676_038483 [Syzygium grande]
MVLLSQKMVLSLMNLLIPKKKLLRGGRHQLAKELSVLHLITIGVGSTVGAGVYILVGTVAREHSGPALTFSFLIAGIAAALSAFCYAELAMLLILEYTVCGSAVARAISPNLALLFGGGDSLPAFLACQYIPGLDIVVDPCAAVLVIVVTGLLSAGIKEPWDALGSVSV